MKPQPFIQPLKTIVALVCAMVVIGVMIGLTLPVDQPQAQPTKERAQEASPASHVSGQIPDQGPDQGLDRPREPRKKILDIRINAKALRARLNRSILRAEETLKLHRAALAKLDEGASPSEVLEAMKRRDLTHNHRSEQRPGQEQSPGPNRLSPQERQAMYQFLRENFPKLANDLEQMTQYNARSADQMLAKMAPPIREILLLTDTQPELAQLKTKEMRAGLLLIEASSAYRATLSNPSASQSDQANAIAKVRQAAADHFDAQLESKKLEVARLEARLNELKASVDEIEQRRDTEIEQMVESTKRNARRHLSKQSNKERQRARPASLENKSPRNKSSGND